MQASILNSSRDKIDPGSVADYDQEVTIVC